jgi:hypothetical protein
MTYILQAVLVFFSLCAGGFWMAAATGKTFPLTPWGTPVRVPPQELTAHQIKWNARAAFSASIAAIAQAVIFLYEHYPPPMGIPH